MIRGMTILWGILVLLVSSAMFLMKMQVQDLEDSLTGINRATRQDREAIRVLEAEWNYLNDPVRLAEQSQRLLAMEPLGAKNIVTLADLPQRGSHGAMLAQDQQPPRPAHARPLPVQPHAELASLGGRQ